MGSTHYGKGTYKPYSKLLKVGFIWEYLVSIAGVVKGDTGRLDYISDERYYPLRGEIPS